MLTPAQLATLKADIAADQTIATLPQNADTAFDIAVLYNKPHAEPFFVWRTQVGIDEIMGNGFVWSRVAAMSAGEFRVWDLMTRLGAINPSQANVRNGIQSAFGAVGDAAMRQSIYGHCQRQATRAERLFSLGTGTSVTNAGTGPALALITDPISPDDVAAARSLP